MEGTGPSSDTTSLGPGPRHKHRVRGRRVGPGKVEVRNVKESIRAGDTKLYDKRDGPCREVVRQGEGTEGV